MKKVKFLIAGAIGVIFLASCVETKEEKAKKEAAAKQREIELAQKKEDDKRKGFHCLSGWDGTHRGVESYVKERLRDPDSYQHKETRITPVKNGKHMLVMEYRAKNGFGGYAFGGIIATIDNQSCKATIIQST